MSRASWNTRLPNGLTAIGEYLPSSRLVALRVRVSTGARNEDPKQQGIAHMLEHTITNARGGRLHTAFHRLGAELNAYTTPDETNFFITVLSEYARESLRLLSSIFTSPTRETFLTQRPVVLQEINRACDTPLVVLYKHGLRALFAHHPIGRDVLGTIPSLEALSSSELTCFWRRWYRPPYMTLGIYGDWEPAEARSSAEACSWLYPSDCCEVKEESKPQAEAQALWFPQSRLSQQYIGVGIPGPGLDIGLGVYSFSILAVLLVGHISARLRQLGVVAQSNAFYVPFADCGFLFILLVVPPHSANIALRGLRTALQSMSPHIPSAQWAVSREQVALRLAIENENFALAARNLIRRWQIAGKPIASPDETTHIRSITCQEGQQAWGQLAPSRCVLALGPHTEDTLPELNDLMES